MPFIDEILKYRSLSIAGLQKNTGKTESLNYILRRVAELGVTVGVTSIGIDGETTDQVSGTAKPEIELERGVLFATSQTHYHGRRLTAEVIELPGVMTALGRVVVGRVLDRGKVLLSGAAESSGTRVLIDSMQGHGADIVIVDGALSRLSLSAPTVTEAMVLSTGAAVSANIPNLVAQTKYVCELIDLPLADPAEDDAVFVQGALTNTKLTALTHVRRDVTLVVGDFTKIFLTAQQYRNFVRGGGSIRVIEKTNLVAVTLNPTSPDGYVLDSDRLLDAMRAALPCAVYNVREL